AVVPADRVDTAAELAHAVDLRDVRCEVAGQLPVEVRRDVRVAGVDAGVEHPDLDRLLARLDLPRQVGADHPQTPQLRVERVHPDGLLTRRGPGLAGPAVL